MIEHLLKRKICDTCGVPKTSLSYEGMNATCKKCAKKEYPIWAYDPAKWANDKMFI